MDGRSSAIREFSLECFSFYQKLREEQHEGEFWDCVVLTACDDDQKFAFEIQLEEKRRRGELPKSLYIVVADKPPIPGCKIGAGGSTFLVIDVLKKKFAEKLPNKKILLIHAGGWSQRLPSASILGKLFMPLPIGAWSFDMLDVKLALNLPFLRLMNNGIFLTASDDIELYALESADFETASHSGIVALGHQSTLQIGCGHGVFVCEQKPSESTSFIRCKSVLQKPTVEEMMSSGAVFHDDRTNEPFVVTDSAYWFDHSIIEKLSAFKNNYGIPEVEVCCYGDFHRPLGTQPDASYIEKTKDPVLRNTRKLLFESLCGSQLQVLFLPKSQFFHLGTIAEYLDNITGDDLFRTCLNIPGKPVMHSNLQYPDSVSAESVLEFCGFDNDVEVGSRCFLSSCSTEGVSTSGKLVVPPGTFMYTAVLDISSTKSYVTIFCGISDDIKKETNVEALRIFGLPLVDAVPGLLGYLKGGSPDKVSLWNAKIFEICSTPGAAFLSALKLIHQIFTAGSGFTGGTAERISMAGILKYKDIRGTIDFRRQMRLTSNPAEAATLIYRTEVDAAKPANFLSKSVFVDEYDVLHIRNFQGLEQFTCKLSRNVCLFGVGKAAVGMFSVLYDLLGDHLSRGLLFAPSELDGSPNQNANLRPFRNDTKIQVLFGGANNLPDENSVLGTRRALEFLASVHQPEVIICLVSGGGSALLVAPAPPVTWAEKMFVIKTLAAKGAIIQELNTVRGNLSTVKFGRLLRVLDPNIQCASLILSDIIGDPLELIGGAPTVQSSGCDKYAAVAILQKYKLWNTVPESVKSVLQSPMEKTICPVSISNISNILVGNNRLALEAGQKQAELAGLQVVIVTSSLHGEAKSLGGMFAALFAAILQYRATREERILSDVLKTFPGAAVEISSIDWTKPLCLLFGGESTVRLVGSGKGGRNQEMALAFAVALKELQLETSGIETPKGCFLSAGSDGQDGPTDATGALISLPVAWNAQSFANAKSSLSNNDSFTFFSNHCDIGSLIRTGLTGTNVMDFQILIVI